MRDLICDVISDIDEMIKSIKTWKRENMAFFNIKS